MAVPISPKDLVFFLDKWGVKYAGYKNWNTHNRNHKGPWGPTHGVMWHHTGSDSRDQRGLLYNGHASLPGPLSQFGVAQTGTVWIIGHGRANHAGKGDPDVLRAIINEDDLPVDNEALTDGNRYFYGIEFWYSGSHEMTDDQYFSGVKLSCALLDYHKWKGESVLGHGQWQPGKWDPGYATGKIMNMDNVQRDVNEALKRGPKPVATPKPSEPTRPEEFNKVWRTDAMVPPKGHATETNKLWWPENVLRLAAEQAEEARINTEKIMKHLGMI